MPASLYSRCGSPEAILAPGKQTPSRDIILDIMRRLASSERFRKTKKSPEGSVSLRVREERTQPSLLNQNGKVALPKAERARVWFDRFLSMPFMEEAEPCRASYM